MAGVDVHRPEIERVPPSRFEPAGQHRTRAPEALDAVSSTVTLRSKTELRGINTEHRQPEPFDRWHHLAFIPSTSSGLPHEHDPGQPLTKLGAGLQQSSTCALSAQRLTNNHRRFKVPPPLANWERG